jgi:thiol-disulfide isomerase/thioredoxin
MKKALVLLVVFIGSYNSIFAQNFFEVSKDKSGNKILKGILSKEDISKDTAFQWFQENQNGYKPYQEAVNILRRNTNNIQFIVFAGTWCGDSKYIIPKFFALLDSSFFPLDRVTLIGVDRDKKTISHLAEALNVINVPTIIVMKDGKEIGRVVEYGKYGMFDKELGEIIKGIPATASVK